MDSASKRRADIGITSIVKRRRLSVWEVRLVCMVVEVEGTVNAKWDKTRIGDIRHCGIYKSKIREVGVGWGWGGWGGVGWGCVGLLFFGGRS